MDKQKIINKICKCLRLSESCNPNEAAAALRQAQGLMRKYDIREEEVQTLQVNEASAASGGYFQPPYWAIALSELVAQAFNCKAYIVRSDDQYPIFRFIGVSCSAQVSAYTFTVLYRQLRRARRDYMKNLQISERQELTRQGNVFAQAWLFRIAKTVAEFIQDPATHAAIDEYVETQYGATVECTRDPASPESKDYDVILSGLKAAERASLFRPVQRTKKSSDYRLNACA